MNLGAALDALKDHFRAGWTHADVPCAFPNEPFDKPVDAQTSQPLPFLVMRIDWNGTGDVGIGAPGDNLARRLGILWFDVLVPVGSGESQLGTLISDVATLFENQDIGPVSCLSADPGGGTPESEDGNYTGESVSLDFTYDETA